MLNAPLAGKNAGIARIGRAEIQGDKSGIGSACKNLSPRVVLWERAKATGG